MPGNARTFDRFSNEICRGPGRICMVPLGECFLVITKASDCRLRVGSPVTSMNCDIWTTGSNTITHASGNCSDNTTFSPGGSSTVSRVTSLISLANVSSLGKSKHEIQYTCL